MPMEPWLRFKSNKNIAAAKTGRHNFWTSDHTLILLFCSVILGVAGFLLSTLWQDYGRAERRGQQRALALVRLLTDNASATLHATDIVLHSVRNNLPFANLKSGDGIDRTRRRTLVRFLRSQQALIPGAVALSLADADGFVYADSLDAGSGVSIADRSDFQDLKASRDDVAGISSVMRGKLSGKPVLHLSRRLSGPDGRFLGVVVASIGLEEHFVSYWKTFQLEEGSSIGLFNRRDDTMIVRYPPLEAGSGKPLPGWTSAPFRDFIASNDVEAAHTIAYPPDATDHAVALRKMSDYPLYGVSSLPRDAYMADWNHQATRVMLAIAAMMVMGGMLTARGITQAGITRDLRDSEESLRRAQAVASIGSWEFWARTGKIVWSEEEYRIHGVPPGSVVTYQMVLDAVHPLDRERLDQAWRTATAPNGDVYDVVHRIVVDGNVKWVRALAEMHFDEEGHVIHMIGTTQDVTESRRKDEALILAASVFDNTQQAIMVTSADGVILAVNPAFTAITGFAAADVLGKNPRILKSGRHDHASFDTFWECLLKTGTWEGQIWNRKKSGELQLMAEKISTIHDQAGRPDRYIALLSDVTEMWEKDERIRFQAYHDALTSLPNRALLADRLELALNLARRNSGSVAVLFLDLDNFKLINDSMGHAVGDRMLEIAAERLSGLMRRSDTVARVGGDEFVLVITDFPHTTEIACVAEKIMASLSSPYEVAGKSLHSSVSIGIAIYPGGGSDATSLLQNADTAMYKAKSAGKNSFRFYDKSMHLEVIRRLDMEANMREALLKNQFELYYQPKVDIKSNTVVGVEALIRWQRPGHGLVSPDAFLPLAEESRLIFGIGNWVLRDVCRQVADWRAEGPSDLKVAFNLSARQFEDDDLVDRVAAALAEAGIPGSCLEIELTETTTMKDPQRAITVLEGLRRLGVGVAIDDFGTGYSSLSYLKNLPISTLKIDLSFVRGIPEDSGDVEIIDSILALGRTFRVAVVAEGVETEAQLECLKRMGCPVVQGYLYARPMPAGNLRPWLTAFADRQSDGS
jgi:diguanylate cyclase (GGDEF)-like protein/PAS domain S-box-containing protein